MAELTVGRELDAAVAGAQGYKQVWVQGTEFWQRGNEPADFLIPNSTSNAVAMATLGEVIKEHPGIRIALLYAMSVWRCGIAWDAALPLGEEMVRWAGKTIAEAISRAIVALGEKQP